VAAGAGWVPRVREKKVEERERETEKMQQNFSTPPLLNSFLRHRQAAQQQLSCLFVFAE